MSIRISKAESQRFENAQEAPKDRIEFIYFLLLADAKDRRIKFPFNIFLQRANKLA